MKLTKLLPITAIASLVAIVTPGVVSCSCNKGGQDDPTPPDPELEPTEPFDCVVDDATQQEMTLGGQYITTKTEQSFEANTEYTFAIDFSEWENFSNTPNKLKIMASVANEEFLIVSSISSISLWFNHEKWVEGTDYEIVEETNGFTYVDWSKTSSAITDDSMLTGRFKAANTAENAFLLTHWADA